VTPTVTRRVLRWDAAQRTFVDEPTLRGHARDALRALDDAAVRWRAGDLVGRDAALVRFVDNLFLVSPEFDPTGMSLHMEAGAEAGEHVSAFFIHWLDLAAPVAIGGLWLWLFFVNLRSRPLLPVRDPYLQDALQSSGGH
jgi:hypothetical protein